MGTNGLTGIGIVAAVVGVLAGCGSQIGEENTFGCLEDSRTDLASGEVPDGFTESGEDAVARLTGTFGGSSDLASDDVALTLTATGPAQIVRRSWRSESGDGGMEPANLAEQDCPDVIVFPASLALAVDGQLDEQAPVEVTVPPSGEGDATLSAALDLDDVVGPATPPFDPSTKTIVELHVSASHDGTSWSGEAGWFYEDPPQGSGDDATVSAGIEPLLAFTCG